MGKYAGRRHPGSHDGVFVAGSTCAGRWQWLHTFAYSVQYIILATVLSFPLTVYQGFFREHSYNLATQTFGAWLGDQFTGLLVGVLIGGMALTLIYGVIRKASKTWWIRGTGVSVLLLLFVSFIAPVYISPLFNDYKALEEGPLRTSIMSIARANGISGDDVYWFDASRKTTRISANVSGAFGTTRISLNDNLLNRTSPEEVEAVMGLSHVARSGRSNQLVVNRSAHSSNS